MIKVLERVKSYLYESYKLIEPLLKCQVVAILFQQVKKQSFKAQIEQKSHLQDKDDILKL